MRARLSQATRQPIKFGLVGIANTAVDLGCFWLLVAWGQVPPLLANTLSYSLGIANSYLLNRIWTFGGTSFRQAPAAQFRRFVLVSLIGLGVSNAVLWTLAPVLPLLAAKLVSIAATFVWNFIASKRFVFDGDERRRRKIRTSNEGLDHGAGGRGNPQWLPAGRRWARAPKRQAHLIRCPKSDGQSVISRMPTSSTAPIPTASPRTQGAPRSRTAEQRWQLVSSQHHQSGFVQQIQTHSE